MQNENIIYGINTVIEALKNYSNKIISINLLKGNNSLKEIIELAINKKVKFNEIEIQKFNNLTSQYSIKRENHQNVFALIKPYEYFNSEIILNEKRNSIFVLILNNITDVHNFGAIIRSATAFNVDYIVIPKDRSAKVNAQSLKTSSGTIFHSKVAEVINITNFIEELKEKGFWIYGADGNAKSKINEIDFGGKVAVVLGSEGEGIKDRVMKALDNTFKIPINEKIESLNVSVAAGIILYEVSKSRLTLGSSKV